MKVALCWYPLKENKINKTHITEVIALQSACQIKNDFISLQPMQLPSKPLNYSYCYEAQLLRYDIRTLYCCTTVYNYANIVPIAKPCDYQLLLTNLTCRLTIIDKYRVLSTYRLRFP